MPDQGAYGTLSVDIWPIISLWIAQQPFNHVALTVDRKIGRYEILGVLGQGGFGITYRAGDTQLSREVAIKEYLPVALAIRQGASTVLPRSTDVADDFVWGRDRFIAEGRTLASLRRRTHKPATKGGSRQA